jgi:hypothetical protein
MVGGETCEGMFIFLGCEKKEGEEGGFFCGGKGCFSTTGGDALRVLGKTNDSVGGEETGGDITLNPTGNLSERVVGFLKGDGRNPTEGYRADGLAEVNDVFEDGDWGFEFRLTEEDEN